MDTLFIISWSLVIVQDYKLPVPLIQLNIRVFVRKITPLLITFQYVLGSLSNSSFYTFLQRRYTDKLSPFPCNRSFLVR